MALSHHCGASLSTGCYEVYSMYSATYLHRTDWGLEQLHALKAPRWPVCVHDELEDELCLYCEYMRTIRIPLLISRTLQIPARAVQPMPTHPDDRWYEGGEWTVRYELEPLYVSVYIELDGNSAVSDYHNNRQQRLPHGRIAQLTNLTNQLEAMHAHEKSVLL